MPGGPIRFQRPARILEPAAGTLSSGLPRVSQPQERAAGKCPAAHRAQNRLEFKQLSPGVSSLFAAGGTVEFKEQHHARNGRSVARATQRPVLGKRHLARGGASVPRLIALTYRESEPE